MFWHTFVTPSNLIIDLVMAIDFFYFIWWMAVRILQSYAEFVLMLRVIYISGIDVVQLSVDG